MYNKKPKLKVEQIKHEILAILGEENYSVLDSETLMYRVYKKLKKVLKRLGLHKVFYPLFSKLGEMVPTSMRYQNVTPVEQLLKLEELELNFPTDDLKKKILVLNDYQVSNPVSGGQVRINRLYSHLSHHYSILLISLNDEKKLHIHDITPNCREISVPKTTKHLKEQRRINDKYEVSANDIVSSYMCLQNEYLCTLIRQASQFCDVVIFSHPYMIKLKKYIIDHKPIIYESHNYETALKESILEGHPEYESLCFRIRELEKEAVDSANIIISCSQEDNQALRILSDKDIYTVENGVDIPDEGKRLSLNLNSIRSCFNGHPVVLFIGSEHIPNIDAVHYIIEVLSIRMPNFYFFIVGSVCETVAFRDLPDNILLFGRVKESMKNVLFALADMAINPIMNGSGSNLKLADYFSHRIPTVTTPFGVRGYTIENYHEAIICELDEFPHALNEIAHSIQLQNNLKRNAYHYVINHLDWRILAKKYANILDQNIFSKKKEDKLFIEGPCELIIPQEDS